MNIAFLVYGFRIKTFKISAINVNASNMKKVLVYPPVASKTLFDTVAIREPAITVKVIRAMLVEKYFIPKKEEVKEAVIVGQEP